MRIVRFLAPLSYTPTFPNSMTNPAYFDNLAELERLALAARRLDGGILAQAPPRLPVGGSEVSGYRDYASGDDSRHIDWNVCARHDELRVRQFGGRLDCHVRLLLDCSGSMGLGSTTPILETARQIVAVLGYVALDQHARLSVVAFSGQMESRIGPLRGKGRAGRLLRELEDLQPAQGVTDFRRVAEDFVRTDQTAGLVVIISDICEAQSFQPGLDLLRLAGLSPRVVHLVDPQEDDSVTAGDIELVDPESSRAWQVTLTESQLRKYRKLAAQDREKPQRYCERFQMPYVRVGTAPDRRVLRDIIATRTPAP
jgi:uncharacterized protein (DUF58 family)